MRRYEKKGYNYKPIVSIAITANNTLRVRLAKIVRSNFGGDYALFDRETMTLAPFSKEDKPEGAMKICMAGQFILKPMQNYEELPGQYKAVQEGSTWRLERISGEPAVVIVKDKTVFVEQERTRSGWPYRIGFPDCDIVNGFFQMK